MATLTVPETYANANAQLGLNYTLAMDIEVELADRLDARALGIARLVGDFAGTGSKVQRLRHASDLGFGTRLLPMAGEADAPADAAPAAGYTSLTIAQKGRALSDTFQSRIFAEPAARASSSPQGFRAQAANMYVNTLRYDVCVAGATIGTTVGSSAANCSIDNLLAAIAVFETTAGGLDRGTPKFMVHLQQKNHLIQSARSEPAFQGSLADFSAVQGVMGNMVENFLGLGIDLAATNDVQTSGGAYQGFATSPGGIAYGVAATSPLNLPQAMNVVYIDNFGIVVYDTPAAGGQTVQQSNVVAFFGVTLGSSDVYPQIGLLGKTA